MTKIAKGVSGDVYFLAFTGTLQYIGARVSVVDVRMDQSGFIIGYLVAKLSKGKSMAFVAGMAVAELSRGEGAREWGFYTLGITQMKYTNVIHGV